MMAAKALAFGCWQCCEIGGEQQAGLKVPLAPLATLANVGCFAVMRSNIEGDLKETVNARHNDEVEEWRAIKSPGQRQPKTSCSWRRYRALQVTRACPWRWR
jgi:hypothetical protein